MPTLFCCILNCEIESVSSKKRKIFYRLPQNSERKQLWLNQIGEQIKYGSISPNSRICNAHFATGKPNLDSSHIDYIPTIFPWSTKEDMSKSHQAVENYELKIKELEQKILAKAFLTASNESRVSSETEVSKLDLDDYSKLNSEADFDPKNKFLKINTQSEINTVLQIPSNISHPIISMANRSSSIDVGNTVTLNSNLLNYLINSLTHVNVPSNTSTVSSLPVSVNISMPTCPLNLSQSYNKTEEQAVTETNKSLNTGSQADGKASDDFFKPINQNGQMLSLQIQNVISVNQNPVVPTSVSAEDSNSRSCTCTKSSCLKLYCECFATGNVCSSGCTCINCRNNNRHQEERAKIVSSYLERDPWVFNSKIDSQEVGKKHTKGCNCLKSSCLKNYCECFENKVFCSNLCRCRLCCNNEEHAFQNHNRKEEVKIYPASHTSDSLSVLSENSPRDAGRKRKPSVVKSNEIYEDVSSNESSDELSIKRQQLDCDLTLADNDRLSASGRSITSMDIPPVLPQEDDFTEEELALMLKFREQRSVMKIESVSPPLASARAQSAPINYVNGPSSIMSTSILPKMNPANFPHLNAPPVLNIPTQIDPTLLLSLSKSLGVANLGVSLVNNNNNSNIIPSQSLQSQSLHLQQHHAHQEVNQLTGADLLNLLVSQQLMVTRSSVTNNNNYGHVIPINLSQQQQNNCAPAALLNGVSPAMLTTSRPVPPAPATLPVTIPTQLAQHLVTPITLSPTATNNSAGCSIISSNCCPIKNKLSTEDYVRRHIEAAERAVRADNMRRDCIGSKKAIMKQKVKIEPNVSPSKATAATMSSTKQYGKPHHPQTDDTVPGCNGHTGDAVYPPSSSCSLSSPWNNVQSQCSSSVTTIDNNNDNINAGTTRPATTTSTDQWLPLSPVLIVDDTPPPQVTNDRKWKNRYKTLRMSLHNMRTELRSIKVHMRADQSKIRRLESALLHMSNELSND